MNPNPDTQNDIIGPGFVPSAQPEADIIGRSDAPLTGPVAPAAAGPVAGTLPERLAAATRTGALTACPFEYSDGTDWRTVLETNDPFAQLYLDYRQAASITDEQVGENARLLVEFWEARRKMLIRGGDRLKARFGEGTIEKAPAALEKAAAALADPGRRQAYATQIDGRRLQRATADMDPYMRAQLANDLMKPAAIQLAVNEGVSRGFSAVEAEQYVLANMRAAGFAPVRTVSDNANTLLLTWTPGGAALANQASTTVLGEKVYSLAEAGQVLYRALAAGDDKAIRNLDTEEYLTDIAQDLKEPDAKLDLREIYQEKKLNQTQRRLKALYLLGPGLPFHLDGGVVPEFASPAELLARTAQSAKDFGVAETAFTAGHLSIWLQAAGTADVKAALPATGKTGALDFRYFLHQAAPGFPLWIGSEAFATTAALAAYIRRDENTWKMVYGSFNTGNLIPWLFVQNQEVVLQRHQALIPVVLGEGTDESVDKGRKLVVQALLQSLEPASIGPSFEIDHSEIDLTGLSGENLTERTLTFTNTTGGFVRVFLGINPPLDGVVLSASELFFDQRAPGQEIAIRIIGNPAQMPRDGQHQAQLNIRTVYTDDTAVPVRAEAVFPIKQFWQFVAGAGLALATIFGGVRFLLGQLLNVARYDDMADKHELLPLNLAIEAGTDSGFQLVLMLVLLGGLVYFFVKKLRKLAKPVTTA